MLSPDFELQRLDKAVQTSLTYIPETESNRQQFELELQSLRDDKELLEGKIRGYLTLSKS